MIWNSDKINKSTEGNVENYRFVCLVQDCTAQLYQFQFADTSSYSRAEKSRLKSKINLL